MGVINITIIASTDQTIPGIPNKVTISTSEPSTIFYTLDSSDPNTFSPIYVAPILMPATGLTVTLKVFATNGMDSSAIIETQYFGIASQIPSIAGDRLPHAATTNPNNTNAEISLFPFGSNTSNPVTYLNTADAGTTVFDESQPATPAGFDADGQPAGFTNKPLSTFQFKQIYSTVNSEGEVTPGVGTLPAKVTVIGKQSPVEYTQTRSDFADKIFNPRALLVFQDSTTEDPTNPVHINRPYFALEDTEIVRDGNLLYNSALDSPTTTGSFVNRHYNPRTNMMTYYYYDGSVGRWIISTTPYAPTTQGIGELYHMQFGRNQGAGLYFKWYLNMYRTLI